MTKNNYVLTLNHTARSSVLLCAATFLCLFSLGMQTGKNASPKIFAQKIVDDTLVAHPEIQGLELSATPPNKTQCVTVASNDPKEIGDKCDDEYRTAVKTNAPLVKREKEHGQQIFAVTLPLHDRSGNIIGTAGIDFRAAEKQEQTAITERAKQIGVELEAALTSREKMFESAR